MRMKMRMNNLKKNKIIKEELKEIKNLNWFDKNKLDESKFQLLLTVTNLVTKKKKKVNLSILTLKTWLIIFKIIQLVKQMLKKI